MATLIYLKVFILSWTALVILFRITRLILYRLIRLVRMATGRVALTAMDRYRQMYASHDTDVERQAIATAEARMPTKHEMRSFLSRKSSVALLVLCLAGEALTCANSSILTAEARKCVRGSVGLTCTMSGISRVTVSPYGQSSCLAFKSPDETVTGSLHIRTEDVTLRCLKQSMYWVPEPMKFCHSTKRCWSQAWCSGKGCAAIGPNKTLDSWPHDKNGEIRCVSSCGCAGCGCGLCTEGCLMYRTGFKTQLQRCVELDSHAT